jgi:hypothetical protein
VRAALLHAFGGTLVLKSLGCAKRASSGRCEGVKKMVCFCGIPPNVDEITILTLQPNISQEY